MSARPATTLAAIWCTMLAVTTRAQPLMLDVVPGFDGICPSEGCYPVTVLIQGQRANAPPATCELQVTATAWNGTAQARRWVTLSGGLVSQAVGFLLCTPEEPYELTARLLLRGRVLAVGRATSVRQAQWYPLLVGLGDESSALAFLPTQRALGVVQTDSGLEWETPQPTDRGPPSHLWPGAADNRRVFIGRVRNSVPPESALAYSGVAAVCLDDRPWDTLNERQQQAIEGYVLSGGLLVVHGVDLARLQTLMPSGLLPVEPLGLTRVPARALAAWMPSVGRSSRLVDVVRARPLGGAQVVVGSADVPLVVVAPRGLGQVVFLAFDPSQPPFQNESAAHSLWKRLVSLQVGRFSPPTLPFPQMSLGYPTYGPTPPGMGEAHLNLIRAMIQAVASKPVPLGWLITYLGTYILVFIPLNYLVLRRLDKLHLSWFTLPALAVLMAAVGYLMATRVQTSSHQIRQYTALYAASGSPQAVVQSDWVVYSARTQRFRLQATVDGTILENSPRDLQASWAMPIPQEEPADIAGVPIPLWSARSFHLSGRTTLPGVVNVLARRDGRQLRIRVENRTPYTLKTVHLQSSQGTFALGQQLAPGAQAEYTLSPESKRVLNTAESAVSYPYQTPEVQASDDPSKWDKVASGYWEALVSQRLGRFWRWDNRRQRWALGGNEQPNPARISQGVLTAYVEGFPPAVSIRPVPASQIQSMTSLAIAFRVQGGQP
jgi:hypothetical protein